MLIHSWHIEMLGRLRVCRGDQIITRFKSQKVAALLAYLAFYPSQPHTRDSLVALLWPDEDLDAARNRLRVSLTSLRHQLEPPGTPTGAVLAADRRSIGLSPDAFTSDVAQFQSALDAAQGAEEEAQKIRWLITAVEGYGGDLLPGFYDEWIVGRREHLTQSYLQALHRLTRSLAQAHDYERALIYARRATLSDPLREEAHRDVMRLYAALGQPSAALQQYEELKRLLKEGMGATPSASTRRLAQQITDSLGHLVGRRSHSPAPAASLSSSALDALSPDDAAPAEPAYSARMLDSLPVFLTRFFGREAEIAQLQTMLQIPESENAIPLSRLLTIIGPGGTGKTRLAVALAQRLSSAFNQQVCFVPLADLSDPCLIPNAVAAAMQLPRAHRAQPLQQIVEALAGRPVLLLLDNFEHLVEEGTMLVTEMLARLPQLSCLLTSRRSLGVAGEYEFPLAPLPVPTSLICSEEAAVSFPSVQLFVDRAQRVRPDFQITPRNVEAVAQLCRELEGIPLALELAGAQARLLTPAQMRLHLKQRFDLLINRRADQGMRHRSMRTVLEWSYHLLSSPLRRLLAQLSVFRGGFSLQAVQAVCIETQADTTEGADSIGDIPDLALLNCLEQLCSNSLITAEETEGEMRFRMLETIREFVAEKLSPEERSAVCARHVTYFISIAEQARVYLKGEDQSVWLQRLQTERDNLRAAFDACLRDPKGAERGLRLAHSLQRFWLARGPLIEGRRYIADALAHPGAQTPTSLRVDALNAAGALALEQDDYTEARMLYEQALSAAKMEGYPLGIATALENLGTVARQQGDLEAAWALLEQALAIHRERDNPEGIAAALAELGSIARLEEDYAAARSLCEQSLAIHTQRGDRLAMGWMLGNLGLIADIQGDYAAARSYHEQSLAIHRELGNRAGISIALSNLGLLKAKQGDLDQGWSYYIEALGIFRELGMRRSVAIALSNMGRVEQLRGDLEAARSLYEQSLAIHRDLGNKTGIAHTLSYISGVLIKLGDYEQSRLRLNECLALYREIGQQSGIAKALTEFAAHAEAQQQWERAALLYGAADALWESSGAVRAPVLSAERESVYARLRVALTKEGFAAAYAAGRATPIESLGLGASVSEEISAASQQSATGKRQR